MKKQLLLFILPVLLFTSLLQAQDIKYWDFGAKELGAGYTNMLPLEYLNAFANYNRRIELTYGDQVYTVEEGYENESGQSVASIYFSTFNPNYASGNFEITSKGSSPTPPGGTLLSGGSEYTKPQNLPDLDGDTDMVFYKDSNSDRLFSTRTDITRYDDRTGMPDDISSEYAGCIQFTTPGAKRYNSSGRFRGFLMNLKADEYLTVVASGEYVDIEGDQSLGCSTGWFSFESFGGTGTPILIEDKGTGTGAFDCSGLDGGDRGDEAPRVMEFKAGPAQTYKLAYRGGRVRVYRMYVSSTSIKDQVTLDVDDIVSTITTDVTAVGSRVYVSNVKSSTEVKIYSITGALVKEFKTSSETNFDFRSGLYIATVKTLEGQKSVKLLVK